MGDSRDHRSVRDTVDTGHLWRTRPGKLLHFFTCRDVRSGRGELGDQWGYRRTRTCRAIESVRNFAGTNISSWRDRVFNQGKSPYQISPRSHVLHTPCGRDKIFQYQIRRYPPLTIVEILPKPPFISVPRSMRSINFAPSSRGHKQHGGPPVGWMRQQPLEFRQLSHATL